MSSKRLSPLGENCEILVVPEVAAAVAAAVLSIYLISNSSTNWYKQFSILNMITVFSGILQSYITPEMVGNDLKQSDYVNKKGNNYSFPCHDYLI